MTPSKATRSWNASRDVHRVLAGHRVDDEQDVRRLDRLAHRGQLVHQLVVDVQSAGRVEDDDVARPLARLLDACALGLHRVSRAGEDRDLDLSAELLELLDGRRAVQVGGDERSECPSLRSSSASFAAVVVLPEPWRPASMITVGGLPRRELRVAAAHQLVSSSWTILTICLAGLEALRHFLAERALAHASTNP